MRSLSRENINVVQREKTFTLLFCEGRQRNVPKCKTHVQAFYFCSLILMFSDVLVATIALVAAIALVASRFPNISSNFVKGVPIIFMKYMKCMKHYILEGKY